MHLPLHRLSLPLPSRARGFTLIELLIVISIIGILTAIALPAYRDSVMKSNRRTAQAEMMNISNKQEQYMMANRSYADKAALVAGGYALDAKVASLYNFDVDPTTTGVPGYIITFTPKANQTGDAILTLNNNGVKMPADKW